LAQDDLERATAQSEGWYYHASAQILLGDCYRQLKRVDKAYEIYRQCLAEESQKLRALYGIGRCAHYLGRPEEALNAFGEILKARPGDTEALLQIAYIYDQQNESDKAVEALREVERLEPEEPQMLSQMAKILRAMGDSTASAGYQNRYEAIKNRREEFDRQRSGRASVQLENGQELGIVDGKSIRP
jgi:tetratricopeptide (TPR) repeat protein